jgi:hypothetical protein
MANLMNLVRSKSRASRGDGLGVSVSASMSVEASTAGGWFGKARSSFMRPWYGGDDGDSDGDSGSASEEGKKAFGETKQVCLYSISQSTDYSLYL